MSTDPNLAMLAGVQNLLGLYGLTQEQMVAYLTTPADGGPANDGMIEIKLPNGSPVTRPALAKVFQLALGTNDILTTGTIAALVEDRVYESQEALFDDLAVAEDLYTLVTFDDDATKNGLYQRKAAAPDGYVGPSDLLGARLLADAQALIFDAFNAKAPISTEQDLVDATGRSTGMQSYSPASATGIWPIIVGQDGSLALGYDADTGAFVGALPESLGGGDQGGGMPYVDTPIADALRPVRSAAGWNGLMTYGQSLSVGALAYPPISTTPSRYNLTFSGGVLAGKAGNSHGAVNTSPGTAGTKALVEEHVTGAGGDDAGETPCSGAANGAVTRAAIENGINPANFVIFASAAGHGGYDVFSLSPAYPGFWYPNFIDHVSQAKARASAAGKEYRLHAVIWMQGEADATEANSSAQYKGWFLDLVEAINSDTAAITGQNEPVHMLIYQTPTNPFTNNLSNLAVIQQAQLEMANDEPLVHMVGPIYHLLGGSVDGVHLAALGELTFGHMAGRAYKELVIDGIEPRRIRPLSATVVGTTLTVHFAVPTAPLRLASDFAGLATDFGFQVNDSVGVIGLSNIHVEQGVNVVMTLARPIVTNGSISYARTHLGAGMTQLYGASGNLRDSTQDTVTVGGDTMRLWHVAPHFNLSILSLESL